MTSLVLSPVVMVGVRRVRWFSCGAASAVATKLDLLAYPDAPGAIVYIEVGAEHPDNDRFLADCERWFEQPITRIRSDEYTDPFDVWLDRRYMSGPNGAPCTGALKFAPRLDFQLPSDTHIWGYTADKSDQKRAERMLSVYPELRQHSPLIERNLTKANVLALIQSKLDRLIGRTSMGDRLDGAAIECNAIAAAIRDKRQSV